MALGLGVQKIKTIGDAFMAASGLLEDAENPVLDCVRLGLQMIEFTRGLHDEGGDRWVSTSGSASMSGPVVAAVLGRRQSLYDLWGDTVNVASRLESHGRPGCVNLSLDAWSWIADLVQGETRGICTLKGKSQPVEVIHIEPPIAVVSTLAPTPRPSPGGHSSERAPDDR